MKNNSSGGVKMKVIRLCDAPTEAGEVGCHGMAVRWLITRSDGAKTVLMRVFEVEPGGDSPFHSHTWEHACFVLDGKGKITCEGKTLDLEPGVALFVPPKKLHRVESIGTTPLKVLECAPSVAEEAYHQA
ncbi:MAG: cupin domain-containing protein [Planctomycetota bacterium]|nr:cupin domain-containing protein [Planctomycetota bacterium]